ncbi:MULTISPECIES: hypothetical protein [unclassified Oceanobacillus]|uniref:hypothetical protein n=1 Tax=unclassified Oceanobacillus TaxID=2630292 RepID=UPI001BE82508|nr:MULTISPECIES: hypothetical protein [unclassified Oceanobacillus]MBT2599115.1 hypothetical protein [Oceanobacillus sp. ISL-74]MBT2652033.1 hypothetical protein [Oceanobacillus sp. ISL-73]
MEINVKIDAPGLEGAIHTLAQVLANYELPNQGGNQQDAVVEHQPQQEQYQAPAQHPVPYQEPTQQAPTQQAPSAQQPPVQQPPVQEQAPQQGTVPTSNPSYGMEELAKAASQLMDAGKQSELVQLLGEFNVQALTALPQEQYGAFAMKLRDLGAKI